MGLGHARRQLDRLPGCSQSGLGVAHAQQPVGERDPVHAVSGLPLAGEAKIGDSALSIAGGIEHLRQLPGGAGIAGRGLQDEAELLGGGLGLTRGGELHRQLAADDEVVRRDLQGVLQRAARLLRPAGFEELLGAGGDFGGEGDGALLGLADEEEGEDDEGGEGGRTQEVLEESPPHGWPPPLRTRCRDSDLGSQETMCSPGLRRETAMTSGWMPPERGMSEMTRTGTGAPVARMRAWG